MFPSDKDFNPLTRFVSIAKERGMVTECISFVRLQKTHAFHLNGATLAAVIVKVLTEWQC